MSDLDELEVRRERERAAAQDAQRTRTVTRVEAPRPVYVETCPVCEEPAERMRVDPLNAHRNVCTGRFDTKGNRIDCYDKLERELDKRNQQEARDTASVVRAAKERGQLTEDERAYLAGVQGGKSTIRALEERFQREAEKRAAKSTTRRPRQEDL